MSSLVVESRGQNALQRRAQQLKRWHELQQEQAEDDEQDQRPRSGARVQFAVCTQFLAAVQQNDLEECARLKREHARLDLNAVTLDGLSALHQMAIDDNRQMTEWLLKNGADVNVRDNEGWTPLHAAASCGHHEIVRLLLERPDCDVFAVNCDAELARDVCDGDQCLELIERRMREKLKETTNDDRRRRATTDGDVPDDPLDDELLEQMRNKELQKIESDLDAFLAANNDKPSEAAVRDWLERTRDPHSLATVVHVCAAKGYDETLARVLRVMDGRSTSDEWRDVDGFTPLMAAAFWRQIAAFELLLAFGANFELKTRDLREIADLCHENQKILQLISETRRTRELHAQKVRETTAETQRKLNAKRQRESRRPTQGVTKEDIEMALKTQKTENTTPETTPQTTPDESEGRAPPMPSSPPPTVFTLPPPTVQTPEKTEKADKTDNHISTTISVPLYPQRRRPKRRSTGIGDELSAEESPSVGLKDNLDSSILSPKPSRDVSSVTSSPQRSRSSSRQSSASLESEGTPETTRGADVRDDAKPTEGAPVDYKALYLEARAEKEALARKVKELEARAGPEWSREKRQLLRRIGELEEELKTKEELQRENARLKEENSALIRVISKLSK